MRALQHIACSADDTLHAAECAARTCGNRSAVQHTSWCWFVEASSIVFQDVRMSAVIAARLFSRTCQGSAYISTPHATQRMRKHLRSGAARVAQAAHWWHRSTQNICCLGASAVLR